MAYCPKCARKCVKRARYYACPKHGFYRWKLGEEPKTDKEKSECLIKQY